MDGSTLLAVLGLAATPVGSVLTFLFSHKKFKASAEADNIANAQAVVNMWKDSTAEERAQVAARDEIIKELQVNVKTICEQNVKLLDQNTKLLDQNRELLDRVSAIEKDHHALSNKYNQLKKQLAAPSAAKQPK